MAENPDNPLQPPDLSLLRPVLRENAKETNWAPHLEHFEKGDKHLYYIGTHHGIDTDNKTHEVISQAAAKYPPQLVILEGLETSRGISPSLGFDKLNAQDAARRWAYSEENVHMAEALRKRNIPFIGGEVAPQEIFKALAEHGYASKDAQALILMRAVGSAKRTVLKQEAQLKPLLENTIAKNPYLQHIPPGERITLDEFKAIYEAHKAELGNKPLIAVTAADSNPHYVSRPDATPNYFQKMCEVMDKARDEHLVKVINEQLGTYDKVMVVYGNAHMHAAMPVFENMFDQKPRSETLRLSEATPAAQPAPAPQIIRRTLVVEPPEESGMAKTLKYAAITLVTTGIIAALATTSALASLALIAVGMLSYRAGCSMQERQQAAAPKVTELPLVREEAPAVEQAIETPARSLQPRDKSWVTRTQAPVEQAGRSVL